jgi:hypothetical protein
LRTTFPHGHARRGRGLRQQDRPTTTTSVSVRAHRLVVFSEECTSPASAGPAAARGLRSPRRGYSPALRGCLPGTASARQAQRGLAPDGSPLQSCGEAARPLRTARQHAATGAAARPARRHAATGAAARPARRHAATGTAARPASGARGATARLRRQHAAPAWRLARLTRPACTRRGGSTPRQHAALRGCSPASIDRAAWIPCACDRRGRRGPCPWRPAAGK